MKNLTKLSFLLLFMLAHIPCALAQPQQETVAWGDFEPVLVGLASKASDIQKALGKEDTKTTQLLDSIKSSVQVLLREWGRDVSDGPKSYYLGLTSNDELLKNVLEKKFSNAQALKVLQSVADDLRIKAAHCVKSEGGWATLINAIVTTKKDGKVVTEHEVWFVQLGWADAPERWERFPKLSSPTEKSLAPGIYMMRVKNGESTPIEIGGDGKNQQGVDLIAP